MRMPFSSLALCVGLLVPSLAMAQTNCEQRKNDRVAGTVIGAGVGALLGSAIAGRGH